jgi:hypothetical protein
MNRRRQWFWTELLLALACALSYAQAAYAQEKNNVLPISKTEFEIVEGAFHDGLGTYAELMLANSLLERARVNQPLFDTSTAIAKMRAAIARLPENHHSRAVFEKEMLNITQATKQGATELLTNTAPASLIRIRHTAREFANAKAADLRLEFDNRPPLPISVKTDKSGKVAVAEGQTPDIGVKWAERYFQVSKSELEDMMRELGLSTMADLKAHYLNVSKLVAMILIRKLGLINCTPTDFSNAQVTNLEAAKYLFRQLLKFKHGSDGSQVIIFDRESGAVKWESLLDAVDIEGLTAARISFRPSRPRGGRMIGSEFGIKIDGLAVVTFQVKHKRGAARDTSRRDEFSDITTRLIVGR